MKVRCNVISSMGVSVIRLRRTTLNNGSYQKWYRSFKIKRFFNASYIVLGKDKVVSVFVKVLNKVVEVPENLINMMEKPFITNENFDKMIRNDNHLSDKGLKQFLKNSPVKQKSVEYNHRVLVEGSNENGNISEFSTITSKSIHGINIDNLNISNKEILTILPTIQAPEKIELVNGFKIEYNSLVKHKSQFNVLLENNISNLNEVSQSFSINIKLSKERVMEQIGWKDYEFFQENGQLFGVHKDNIMRIGNFIFNIDMTKKKPVMFEDYGKICNQIANNPELDKFINLDPNIKEVFEKNYKIYIDSKKD